MSDMGEHKTSFKTFNDICLKENQQYSDEEDSGAQIKSRVMPLAAMRDLDKRQGNFSMKLCKYHANGLKCLNKLKDDFCVYSHDECCKKVIELS